MSANGNLSPEFLRDLNQVYSSLPVPPKVDYEFLTIRFTDWRRWAEQMLRSYREALPGDDPLLCPMSLFRTMDLGRLETAHTRTLAWLLDPKKEHGFGDTLLAGLLRHLTTSGPFDRLTVTRVEPELRITNNLARQRTFGCVCRGPMESR